MPERSEKSVYYEQLGFPAHFPELQPLSGEELDLTGKFYLNSARQVALQSLLTRLADPQRPTKSTYVDINSGQGITTLARYAYNYLTTPDSYGRLRAAATKTIPVLISWDDVVRQEVAAGDVQKATSEHVSSKVIEATQLFIDTSMLGVDVSSIHYEEVMSLVYQKFGFKTMFLLDASAQKPAISQEYLHRIISVKKDLDEQAQYEYRRPTNWVGPYHEREFWFGPPGLKGLVAVHCNSSAGMQIDFPDYTVADAYQVLLRHYSQVSKFVKNKQLEAVFAEIQASFPKSRFGRVRFPSLQQMVNMLADKLIT